MLMLVSPLWSSQTHRPERYVVLLASASLLTVLEVMALSLSADPSAGSLKVRNIPVLATHFIFVFCNTGSWSQSLPTELHLSPYSLSFWDVVSLSRKFPKLVLNVWYPAWASHSAQIVLITRTPQTALLRARIILVIHGKAMWSCSWAQQINWNTETIFTKEEAQTGYSRKPAWMWRRGQSEWAPRQLHLKLFSFHILLNA